MFLQPASGPKLLHSLLQAKCALREMETRVQSHARRFFETTRIHKTKQTLFPNLPQMAKKHVLQILGTLRVKLHTLSLENQIREI